MNHELYEELRRITPEEQRALDGCRNIEKELYMSAEPAGEDYIIEANRLLDAGKLIRVRKHPRFVHFPEHTHNYVEMVYVCSGQIRQRINQQEVVLRQGELMILNQHATQEIFPAGREDIAVNFIILPAFFDATLKMLEQEPSTLRDFLVDCLREESNPAGYLHFKVADLLPIQNLLENLIWTVYNDQPNKRSINQMTMGLLFLQLMNHMDRIGTPTGDEKQQLTFQVLQYIEEHYKDGELQELSDQLHYNMYWLSKEIKKQTGYTYTELVQRKRLSQAAYLLRTTAMSVLDVGMAVGYDNQSYFHRIFQKEYGTTPRRYRQDGKSDQTKTGQIRTLF